MREYPGLHELIETMHTLVGEHGCAWDKQQTHESLIPYLVEESHELIDAIEEGSQANLKEELGDVLYQVLFHAVLAEAHPVEPFSLDDVARQTAVKMQSRHPHVFAGVQVSGVEEIRANWRARKAAEKAERTSVFDGVPRSLPPLDRAGELLARADTAGLRTAPTEGAGDLSPEELGDALLDLVSRAKASGLDASEVLRTRLRRLERELRAEEASRLEQRPKE